MKIRSAAICLVISLSVLVAIATPSIGATPPPNFRTTLIGTVTGSGGNCCFSENDFEGTTPVPRVGLVTFTGFILVGCFPFGEPECEQFLAIDVVGPNGRTLAISGSQFWSPFDPQPPQGWTAGGSRFTGSGTYVITPNFHTLLPAGTPVTIELRGTLQPA